MRKLIPAVALLGLFLGSCSKSEDTTPTPTPTPTTKNNTWKLGGTTYVVNNYAKTSDDFQAYDTSGNGMIFSFNPFPTADGSYTVVNNSATLGANQMKVVAFGATSGSSYFATGFDKTTATVKVISSSRLSITLPDTWVVKGGTDSLKLSVSIGDL